MSIAASLHADLLLAAFAEPARALPAWQRWQARAGWESALEFDAYLLLSRVFHNLGGGGVDDALFRLLKGVVKRNWLANSRRLAVVERLANTLQDIGIVPVLLPPTADLLAERGTPVEDGAPLALLVERAQARAALTQLLATGWHPAEHGVPRWCLTGYLAGRGRLLLRHGDGTALALYVDDGLAGCGNVEWHEVKGRRMACAGPAASVRFLLAGQDQGAEFRQLARALLVLARAADRDGWGYLLQHLRQQDSPFGAVVESLAPAGLRSLEPQAPRPIVVTNCTMVPASERGVRSAWARLRRLWRRYRRALGPQANALQALCDLPGYLLGKWRLRHWRELPLRVWRSLRYHWRHEPVPHPGAGAGPRGAPPAGKTP